MFEFLEGCGSGFAGFGQLHDGRRREEVSVLYHCVCV